VHFVLDIEISVSIIYIWYEEGLLKPFLVTLHDARGCSSERARRQPLATQVARETQMKGGIEDNGEESQGREEEGRQETLSQPRPQ